MFTQRFSLKIAGLPARNPLRSNTLFVSNRSLFALAGDNLHAMTASDNIASASQADGAGNHLVTRRFPRLRRVLKWGLAGSLVAFAFIFGVLYARMDFPNEIHVMERSYSTEFLAQLQGHCEVSAAYTQASPVPLIIGHRGSGLEGAGESKGLRIGNTERSIQSAIDAKADWIEIDIRISDDGQLVVFHDDQLAPKTNCDEADKRVCNLEWSVLEKLQYRLEPQEKLWKLDDLLRRFNDPTLKWIFDIKPEECVNRSDRKKELLLPILRELGPKRVILFGDEQVIGLYRQASDSDDSDLADFDCGVLIPILGNFGRFLYDRAGMIEACKRLDAKYVVIPGMFAEASFVQRADDEELEVWVWDCNHPTDQKNLIARGVHGLIVDEPKETNENLGRLDRILVPVND